VLYFVVEICFLIFYFRSESTALHDAAVEGRTAVCELLIAGKADVDAKDKCAVVFQFCYGFCVFLKFASNLLF
jgi:hypothetical protein